ncbi:MAG: hypothetical protein IPI67_05960 [Myxococcales bacterium]|nr:hypothetical protein [Myxococcales bacterium]
MSKHWTLGIVTVFVAVTAGCATTTSQAPETRMVASGQQLWVEVEGGGAVDLGPSEERCDAIARCQLRWDRVAEPVLVAEAKPGWRFDHWEAPGAAAESPSFGDPSQPRLYRAVFRRSVKEIAAR